MVSYLDDSDWCMVCVDIVLYEYVSYHTLSSGFYDFGGTLLIKGGWNVYD